MSLREGKGGSGEGEEDRRGRGAAVAQGFDFSEKSLSERDFRSFREMIYQLSGIHLPPEKKVLLVGRLGKRLRALGLDSYGSYYDYLQRGDDPEETSRMLDSVCTNETQFFREPHQFEFLEKVLFPRWEARSVAGGRTRRLKVWSAACSTGEEPYSVAMVLLGCLASRPAWSLDILASDLSTTALERAMEGVWPAERAEHIPKRYLTQFMLKGTGSREGSVAAGPELRSVIRFRRLNLAGEAYPPDRDFDLILCRNVIIYFDAETKTRVIMRMLGHLAPEGYLFLGHAESIHGMDAQLDRHIPAVYSLKAASRERPLPQIEEKRAGEPAKGGT